MNADEIRCTTCGRGALTLVGRRGRMVQRHGVEIEVPCDFMIPTCAECGTERRDAALMAELDVALAKAQRAALRAADTTEMDALGEDPEAAA